jgi:hypothetical protein
LILKRASASRAGKRFPMRVDLPEATRPTARDRWPICTSLFC